MSKRILIVGGATDRLELLAALAKADESVVLVNAEAIELHLFPKLLDREKFVFPKMESQSPYIAAGCQKRLHKQKGRNRHKY